MMALPRIVARNTSQVIPDFSLNLRKVLSGGTDGDFYTVPTGKKARIIGTAVCTGLGAAVQVTLNVATVGIYFWQAAAGGGQDPRVKIVNDTATIDIMLDAGEILQYSQDSGTNAEFNIFVRIQETAA